MATELPPKWSLPQLGNGEVLWVATLDEDYQPSPLASYVAIGADSVPRMLSQLTEIITYRRRHPEWRDLSRPLAIVADRHMDLGSTGEAIERFGDRLGIRVIRADGGGA